MRRSRREEDDRRAFGRDAEHFLAESTGADTEGAMYVALRLVRAGNAFIRASERAVQRPRRLTWSGFSVLFALLIYPTLEARSIARFTGVSRQTMSTVLRTLQRDGLVERARADEGGDRRLVPLTLSDEGRRTARESLAAQIAISEEWLAPLQPAERVELGRLLEKILQTRSQ